MPLMASRWAITGTPTSLISSGVTNARPSTKALAWEARSSAKVPRGLTPKSTPRASREARAKSTMYSSSTGWMYSLRAAAWRATISSGLHTGPSSSRGSLVWKRSRIWRSCSRVGKSMERRMRNLSSWASGKG